MPYIAILKVARVTRNANEVAGTPFLQNPRSRKKIVPVRLSRGNDFVLPV
ncbi:MAG: hypothetical protein K6B46_01675 [Opitutales bacterium]|nr:hypothetical protein [Opitutales bacterium]